MNDANKKLNSRELFLKACAGDCDLFRPPVWFMRQAGRYLPEYQAIRKQVKFLELCRNPALAAEVSLQPVEIIGVDAAIIFSDILLPLADFGIEIDFPESGGIKVNLPDTHKLSNFKIGSNIQSTISAIKILGEKLKEKDLQVPVLGFAGAPWTLANYIYEGGTGRKGEFSKAKQMIYENPAKIKELLQALSDMTITYLQAQIEAGAEAVQLFDTWAGELTQDDYAEFAFPFAEKVFSELPRNIPKIYYMKGVSPYLSQIATIGADILSVDWKVSLTQAWNQVSSVNGNTIKCLQGNLDPLILTTNTSMVKTNTKKIIEEGKTLGCGHILNLGHGVTPDAKVDCTKAFVMTSKELG
jgi:uroporphyrinogen decarboxylase